MQWRIELLGGLRVTREGQVVTRLESSRSVALLARLALAPHRRHPREELAALLWPEADTATGLARLRHTLSSLRRSLVPAELSGEAFFVADRQSVLVRAEALDCDVLAFEQALQLRDFSRARALYQGELLPGLYDDWLCDERTRLAALAERLPELPARPPEPLPPAPAIAPLPRAALPAYLSGFYGREHEQETLRTLLQERRLVTLLGPGGIGKTRLATELAHQLAPHRALVGFVGLAECFDPAQLPDRIRAALGLTGEEHAALEQLVPFCQGRPGLLVLDNLEQLVVGGVVEVVEQLLHALPTTTFLVTSRQVLGVPGEQVFPLEPLPLEWSRALFLDRARTARPDFTLSESNRESLERICARLEGLPLALELAASRIRSVGLREMQAELERSLRLLTRPEKRKLTRHGSLHAALEWSWHLLAPAQQRFLARLSVFQGGWSAAAAAQVCEQSDAEERLAALVDASLVQRTETPAGTSRFRLLEPLRAFVEEQLPLEERAQTAARHRAYFARQATPDDSANVVAALESACAAGEGEIAYPLFCSQANGALASLGAPLALALGEQVLALAAPTRTEHLLALGHTVAAADTCGQTERARTLAAEALTQAGMEPQLRAIALSIQGQLAISNYDPPTETIPLLQEALPLAEQAGDRATQATLYRRLGILLLRSRQLDAARACFEHSEAGFQALGDAAGARYALANRAHVLGELGDPEGALALYTLCLQRAVTGDDLLHQSKLLLNIGSLQAGLGRWDDALESGRACIRHCQAVGNLRTLAFALWNLPEPLLHTGQTETASVLLAFAEAFWLARFGFLTADDRTYRDQLDAACGTTEGQRLVGRTLTLPEAITLALR